MQSGRLCMSTQEYAPRKVPAYAHTMPGLPSQPVCTLNHLQAGFVKQMCASHSQIQKGQSWSQMRYRPCRKHDKTPQSLHIVSDWQSRIRAASSV